MSNLYRWLQVEIIRFFSITAGTKNAPCSSNTGNQLPVSPASATCKDIFFSADCGTYMMPWLVPMVGSAYDDFYMETPFIVTIQKGFPASSAVPQVSVANGREKYQQSY